MKLNDKSLLKKEQIAGLMLQSHHIFGNLPSLTKQAATGNTTSENGIAYLLVHLILASFLLLCFSSSSCFYNDINNLIQALRHTLTFSGKGYFINI